MLFRSCAALRLARFNTFQADMRGTFVGLPSPAAGGVMASFILFYSYFEDRPGLKELDPWAYYAFGPMAVGLALLMMSTVRYQKNPLRTLVMAPRRAFFTLWVWALVIAFVIHLPVTLSIGLLLFPLGVTYVLFGIGDHLYRRFSRRATASEALTATADAESQDDGRHDFAQPPQPAVKKEERL